MASDERAVRIGASEYQLSELRRVLAAQGLHVVTDADMRVLEAIAKAGLTVASPAPIDQLIARSSLGTPDAVAARGSVPSHVVDRVLARADELDGSPIGRAFLMGMSLAKEGSGLDLSRSFGWSGCPAELACLHYLLGDDDDPPRPTALCRACSKAAEKREELRARRGLE